MESSANKKLTERQIYEAYMQVFDSKAGEIVLEDMKQAGFFYTCTYAGDAEEMKLNEGMRNHVLRILTILDTHPDQFKTDTGVGQKEG